MRCARAWCGRGSTSSDLFGGDKDAGERVRLQLRGGHDGARQQAVEVVDGDAQCVEGEAVLVRHLLEPHDDLAPPLGQVRVGRRDRHGGREALLLLQRHGERREDE